LDLAKLSKKEIVPPFFPKVLTDEELAKLSGEEIRESEVLLGQLDKIKDR